MVRSLVSRLHRHAMANTAPYSLAAFRVVFGFLLLYHTVTSLLRQTVFYTLEATEFKFKYSVFAWLEPLPGRSMEVLWLIMALAAVGIILGLFYRISAATFALIFSYSFFLDASNYTNADYLTVLLSWLLVLVPAHSGWSLDNARRKAGNREVKQLYLLVLQAQFLILYVGGGIAKLNSDWLNGGPLTILLAQRSDFPLVGEIFAQPGTGLLLSYFGLFFDLSIVFLVMYKRTRILGFLLALGFHGMNSQLFSIGYFPWLSLFGLTLFMATDWPQKALGRVGLAKNSVQLTAPRDWGKIKSRFVIYGVTTYLIFQAFFPFRHFIVGKDFVWDDNGNTFSWHMITAYKEGTVIFEVRDGAEILYRGPAYDLTVTQKSRLIGSPELIRQYAHHIAEVEQAKNDLPSLPQVYVIAPLSVDGREEELLIDPAVNMADQGWFLFTPDYVRPLTKTMPDHDELLKTFLNVER